MPFKFENLEVWQLSLEYIDVCYEMAELLPRSEEYNLKSQLKRAATSVALNIAEGSTGQSDAEQARFLNMAIRSLLETVACFHIIKRRELIDMTGKFDPAYKQADRLTSKLQAFRRAINPKQTWIREAEELYLVSVDDESSSIAE